MCGISFIYSTSESLNTSKSIQLMLKTLRHRGPDETNVHSGTHYSFGFNRLRIIGGRKGSQPIISGKNEQLILVCNGEIFNHRELKKQHFNATLFKTTSDVEIIAHLYERFGVRGFSYLEGQFAFILYDRKKQKIVLGRDYFGINPLFYSKSHNTIVASSEVKSILELIPNPSLDTEGILETYFFYGPLQGRTCFTDIHQVPRGHIVEISVSSFEKKTIPIDFSLKSFNTKGDLNSILKDSIKKRLMGNSVPGVYLSGGLDSSIVAYLTNKLSKKKPLLFSICFRNKSYDESHYQDALNKLVDCKHVKIYADPESIKDNLIETIYQCETPLTRLASVPLGLLSREVRRHGVKFVLCGEGADELYAGYPVFMRGFSSIEDKWNENTALFNYINSPVAIEHICSTYKILCNHDHTFAELSRVEIETKLSGYLLSSQGDRTSMKNGVEQRFPFLDLQSYQYSVQIPKDRLIRNGRGKYPLRETYKSKLPRVITERVKQGFLTPDLETIQYILNDDDWKQIVIANIDRFPLFNSYKIRRLLNKVSNPSEARIMLFFLTVIFLDLLFIQKKYPFLKSSEKTN